MRVHRGNISAVAREMGKGSVVVTILADGFERYLGKGIFENL